MSDRRRVRLGVVEFHSDRLNPGLYKRFYDTVEDLRDSGCIVDVWLMDIASVCLERCQEGVSVTDQKSKKQAKVVKSNG